MGGLTGSWTRIHDARMSRADGAERRRWQRSKATDALDTMTGVTWLAQITIPKRWCLVHKTWDRCWRKPKEASR